MSTAQSSRTGLGAVPATAGQRGTTTADLRPADQPQLARHRASRELGAALDRIPFQRVHVLILVLVAVGTLINAIEEY
ncbi:MAG: hypothetical protein J2P17_17380, partial [Mycobacterium sp.]|nr:hypothetical protein [Mycobacterium sp.]